MKKMLIGVIVLLAAAVAAYLLLWKNASSKEPIRIGAILMLTEEGANNGLQSQRGADLAVEDINNDGGINGRKLEMVYEDNKGDNPRAAVSAFFTLFRNRIRIILGPNWSPSGLALAPLARQKQVLMISPTLGVAGFNEESDYLFNLWPHDFFLSRELGKLVYNEGHRKIAVLGSQQAWEQEQAYAVKKSFENAGGEVVFFQLPSATAKEFPNEVQEIKEIGPDAVVLTLSMDPVDLAAKQLRKAGVSVPLYTVLLDQRAILNAEGALEEAVAMTSFTPSQEFIDRFARKYNEKPDYGSDTSYDTVMLLAQAMRETSSTDPSVLKDHLNALKKYEGVSGTMIFDGKGGVTKPFVTVVVKNNAMVPR